MLNCVNALDSLEQHLPATEQSGLMTQEEKNIHESSGSEHSHSSRGAGDTTTSTQPPPLPPPRYPNSAV